MSTADTAAPTTPVAVSARVLDVSKIALSGDEAIDTVASPARRPTA